MANIFSNYKKFVESNAPLFESVEGLKSLLIDEMEYKNFKEALLEGIENDGLGDLLDRQREVLLESADATLSSPEAIAFSVASLPMVTMVYSSPTLSNDGTVIYNMNKPVSSIPVLEWVAKIIDIDGSVNTVKFPTAMEAVRPGIKEITRSEEFFNIYEVLGITKDDFRISKRGLMLTGVKVTETDADGNKIEHDNVVYAAVDARGHFSVDYTITAADDKEVTFRVSGTINAVNGEVTWNNVIINKNDTTSTFETDSITIKCRVIGNGINKAVVKVEPLNTVIDINADNPEKFEIENIVEVIQDWKALYNVDILAQLTDMVKLQIELNRDYDIADLLRAEEQNAVANGLNATLDFAKLPSVYYENPRAVLSSIVPKIMIVRERIHKLTRRWADIIATGTDMAALLKSIQDFAINLPNDKGEFGLAGFGIAEFAKMKIIGSNALDNNVLYMWKKGSSAGDATLLTAIYKPLVIVEETTNARKRIFVESRYSINLLRKNSVGVIKIENYQGFLA